MLVTSPALDRGRCAAAAEPEVELLHERGGRRGIHTESLGYMLSELQFMQRAYPGLQW